MRTLKKTVALVAIAVTTVGGYLGNKVYNKPVESTLLMQNVEALSRDEEPYPNERLVCISEGGNWNMASVCDGSGFEEVTCTTSGEVNIFGIKLSGSYTSGHTYRIPWARYTCKESNGNCCKKQGLYSGEIKLA